MMLNVYKCAWNDFFAIILSSNCISELLKPLKLTLKHLRNFYQFLHRRDELYHSKTRQTPVNINFNVMTASIRRKLCEIHRFCSYQKWSSKASRISLTLYWRFKIDLSTKFALHILYLLHLIMDEWFIWIQVHLSVLIWSVISKDFEIWTFQLSGTYK